MENNVLSELNVVGPHNGTKLIAREVEEVEAAILLMHGRGADAADMLGLVELLRIPKTVMVMVVEANNHEWYPGRFLVPRADNQPYLDSALAVVGECLRILDTDYGLGTEKVVLGGFSQGACLVADYCARNPRKYGGVAVLSGGLIGSKGELEVNAWDGDLLTTPVLVGCDERDVHIPLEWVEKTIEVMRNLGGDVNARIYSGLGHTINQEELEIMRGMVKELVI